MYQLLSHNDLDGVGCGILAKLAFNEEVKVKYNSVSSLDNEIAYFLEHGDPHTFLIITDLAPSEENVKKLNEFYQSKGKVLLLDHHKTALYLDDYEWGYVSVENKEGQLTSATSLFYQYLVTQHLLKETKAISEFVELVRQYDTWEWEKNDNYQAHMLNSLFYLLSIEEFEEKMLRRLHESERFEFDEFEKKLLSMEADKINRYIRRKKRELIQVEVGEFFAGIVFAELYHSELGNELGKEYPHLDFIAIVNMGGKRLSFRTIHDHIDVSHIASHFGGGGHQKAAGCSLTDEAYKKFVIDTFHIEPIQEDAKRNRYNLKQSSFGSLYKNKEDVFLLYPKHAQEWAIEHNKNVLSQSFTSFMEAEKFLKRKYAVWLVNDDVFVEYLLKEVKKKDQRDSNIDIMFL